jgi:hypothetical protein
MSDNPLYDINTAYPFIWSSGVFPDALKAVRDMRIALLLPSTSAVPDSMAYDFKITALTSSGATVDMRLGGGAAFSSTLTIPLRTSGTTTVMSSFVALDDAPATEWSGSIDIHPDCVILMQEAPRISVEVTSSYYSDHSRSSEVIGIPPEAVASDGVLRFAHGYNVVVDANDRTDALSISFDCGSDNGLGTWRTSPWTDKTLDEFKVTGLRGINGVTGNVIILGDASVNINTTADSGAGTSGGTVTLDISGREVFS